METHSSANPSKRFFFRKKSYSPAGLFQITIFRRCDLRTQTWSDSASENYAFSSFPLQRASQSELSKLLFKDPSIEHPGSQRISPTQGTQARQKTINNHDAFTSKWLAGIYFPNHNAFIS